MTPRHSGFTLVNWVDPILLVILFLFGLRGYFKGLFRESFSLGGLIVGFIVAVRYDDFVAGWAALHWNLSSFILKGVAFVAIFFIVYFVFSLIGWVLHCSAKMLFLQTINHLGGIAVGLGKGAAITALIIFFLTSSAWIPRSTKERLEDSYLVPPLSQLAVEIIRVGAERLFPRTSQQALGQPGVC
jgi:membrane protein required for colicin V production